MFITRFIYSKIILYIVRDDEKWMWIGSLKIQS